MQMLGQQSQRLRMRFATSAMWKEARLGRSAGCHYSGLQLSISWLNGTCEGNPGHRSGRQECAVSSRVALGAVTEVEIDKGTYDSHSPEITMTAVADSAPVTMEDYRKVMEKRVKLPGDRLQAKLAARSSAKPHANGPSAGQRNKTNPEQG